MVALSDLEKVRLADEWADMKGLVEQTATRWWRRHGGHLPDVLADAVWYFYQAMEKYNRQPRTVTLARYVVYCVDQWLMDAKVAQVRRHKIAPMTSVEARADGGSGFAAPIIEMSDVWETISDDAKEVVALVLDTPQDLAKVIKAKGGLDRNWRSSIRNYLGDLGWASSRVSEAFAELREVLSC